MATTMEIVVSAQDNASGVIEGVGNTAERTGGQIESSWDSASSAAETGGEVSAGASRNAAGGLNRMGEATDEVDTKAMGFRDAMTGVQDSMSGTAEIAKGNLFEGFFMLGAGVGDLASSATNLLVPALSSAVTWLGNTRVGMLAKAAAAKVVRGAVVVWTGVQWALNAALTANPIGLVVVAIAALVAAIVLAWKNSETFRDVVRAVWEGIQTAVSAVVDWFMDHVWPTLQAVWDGIVEGVRWVWQRVQEYFGLWRDVLQNVIGWVSGVWDSVHDTFDRVVGFVRDLPGRIRSAASGLWDGITDTFRGAINTVIGWWNGLSFSLSIPDNAVTSALGLGGRGFTISTPNIPRLHEGGIFRAPRPGGEGLALLRDRERVTTSEGDEPGGGGDPGSMTLKVERGTGGNVEQTLATLIAYLIRTGALRLRVRNGRVVVS